MDGIEYRVNRNEYHNLRKGKDHALQRTDREDHWLCAYRVYNKMGFGFLESVYEKCLLIELRKAALRVESQQPIMRMLLSRPSCYPVKNSNLFGQELS